MSKKAKVRIKINDLLKEAGWKLFEDSEGKVKKVIPARDKLRECGMNDEEKIRI